MWADTSGTIGFQAAGLTPERATWNGLMPVPGDGRYEWSGFRPMLDLPHQLNPASGWLAAANNDMHPPGYARPVGYTWSAPNRYARIAEVLSSGRQFTLADMMRLQQDEACVPARALIPFLRAITPRIDLGDRGRKRLLAWDLVLDSESTAAAIYVFWENALIAGAHDRLMPALARDILRTVRVELVIDWLTSPDGRFGVDPLAGRDAFVLATFEEAVDALRQRAGSDMTQWRYGQPGLKHILLRHPLSAIADPAIRARLDVGPLPRGGNSRTVNATGDELNQTDGASVRMIADTGDWDASVATNTPGQSGDPASAHYADLFASWACGTYFPIFFSRARVDSVAEETLGLLPIGASPRQEPR